MLISFPFSFAFHFSSFHRLSYLLFLAPNLYFCHSCKNLAMPFILGEQVFEKSVPILKTKQMSAGGRLNLEKPAVCRTSGWKQEVKDCACRGLPLVIVERKQGLSLCFPSWSPWRLLVKCWLKEKNMTRKHSDIYSFQSDISYRNNYREYGKEVQFSGGSMLRIPLQCRRYRFDPWVRKILWRRKW